MVEFDEEYEDIFTDKLLSYLNFNREIISQEGLVEVIEANSKKMIPTNENYKKDFLMFCLTKFTKTLSSIIILMNNNLNEDALILSRSNYEIMLHTKAVGRNEELINHFIQYKLGLVEEEYYKYKRGNYGKRIWNKIVDNDNLDSEIEYISKIQKIAEEAGEKDSHNNTYNFLCELSHCNFLTSGYYRNGKNYTLTNDVDRTKNNVLLLNMDFSLKLYGGLLESGIFRGVKGIEDRICSLIIEDKIILQKWVEEINKS